MKKSKISILLLFFVMILAISAVSAADTNDTSDSAMQAVDEAPVDEVASADVDKLASTDSSSVLADPGEGNNFTALQYLIDNKADDGMPLMLQKDYKRDSTEGVITINKNIAIMSMTNQVIDGNYGGIFKINQGVAVLLNGLTLINGNSTNGGAIYNDGQLNIRECTFTDNTADVSGGAIYSDGTLTITNSKFNSNKVTNTYNETTQSGGSQGGAIYATGGELKIVSSSFTENTATPGDHGEGAAIYAEVTTTTISGTTFKSNRGFQGGAVKLIGVDQDTLVFNNCIFDSNIALQGGAIDAQGCANLRINDTIFIDNQAYSDRYSGVNPDMGAAAAIGAAYVNDIIIYVNNSKFIRNTVTSGPIENSGFGAAIISTGSLIIDNTEFTDNAADKFATLRVYYNNNAGTVSITNSNFTGNKATKGDAAVLYTSASKTATIDNCKFENNEAHGNGVILADGPTEIKNSEFTGNVAANDTVIYANNKLTLQNNRITSGDIVLGENGEVDSEINVVIANNGTIQNTGAEKVVVTASITDDKGNNITNAEGFKFVFNGAEIDALYNASDKLYYCNLTMATPGIYTINMTYTEKDKLKVKTATLENYRGTFTDLQDKVTNAQSKLDLEYDFIYTPKLGDTAYVNGIEITSALTIDGHGFTISGNETARIFLVKADLNINNVTLSDAYTNDLGGAIRILKIGITLKVNNSNFTNNVAKYGSSICDDDYASTVYVDNCIFDSNDNNGHRKIDQFSGAPAIFNWGTLIVNNSVFSNNLKNFVPRGEVNQDFTHAAIWAQGTAKIYNSNFTNNKGSYGGAIGSNRNAGNSLLVDNCRFINNTGYDGGAIHISRGTAAEIKNSYFENNTVLGTGSAGTDSAAGGAICINDAVSANIVNCIFKDNKVGDTNVSAGGAIAIGNTPIVDISDCTFENNSAADCGGAIDISSKSTGADKVTVTNCNFTDNSAEFGGAISLRELNTKLNVSKSNFTDNNAKYGNAIFIDNGTANVEDSTFTNNGEATDYAIYNKEKTLELTRTTVDNLVYTSGTFNTEIDAVFLDNKTWNGTGVGDTYTLNATLTDKNRNKIYDPNFRFAVDGVNITDAPKYNETTGLYTVEYYIESIGLKVISTNYQAADLNKYPGALYIPVANVTKFTVEVEDTLEGDNATVLITLLGPNGIGLNSTVRILISNVGYTVDVKNGTGYKSIEDLTRGVYPVMAFFNDNPNYNDEINSTVFYVKGNSTLTIDEITTAKYFETVEITINLTSNGKPLTGIVVIDGIVNLLVENGTSTFVLDGQPYVGEYTFKAVYEGDDTVFGSFASFIVNVTVNEINPDDVDVKITKENEVGDNITVTITSPVDGDYKVTIDGTDMAVPVTVVNGTGVANITGLPAGIYNATVQSADGNYTLQPIKVGEFYNFITPAFTIDISGTYPNATIKINGTPGTYHVAIPGFEVANITITGSEVATVPVRDIDAGPYTAIVEFDKTAEYYGMTVDYKFFIDKADTILKPVALTTAKYGDKIEVNITLTDADGNPLTAVVVVNETFNVLIDNGEGVFVIDNQPDVDEYTFTAVFSGDNNYNNNSAEFKVNVIVNKIDPKDVVVDIPNINEYGDNITVTITSPVDGIYNVTVNKTSIVVPVEVVNGKGSVNITGLAPGIYNAIVQLTEKGYSLEPIITDSFENLKTPAFHAEITGTYPNAEIKVFGPAGTYHVYIDGFDEINITVSGYGMPGIKNISNIAAGKYNATVTFDKHGEYYGGANNTVFTVNKAPITITPVVIGDKVVDSPINITFTLPTDLDPKAVHAFINGVAIPELVVNETTGVYTAVFSGFKVADGYTFAVEVNDTNYDVTCDNVGFIIKKVTPEINITDIGGNVGETVEANVTITGGDATGYILFNGSFYPVENGKATIPVVLSNSGMQGITVIYTGDDKYFNGTANKGFNVGKAASKIVLVEDEINITIGEDVEIIFAVDPSVIADGNVTVWINDDVHTEFIITQSGLYSVKILSKYLSVYGNYTIKVQYNGNVNYNASNVDSLTINVDKINLTGKVKIEGSKIVYGQNGTITVEFGNLANLTGNVTVKLIGDNGIYNASVEGGYATVVIPGLGGNKTYYLESVVFSGNKVYHGFTIYDERVTIEVAQAPSVVEIDAIPNPTYPGSLVINYAVINATKINVTVYDGNDKEVLSKEFNASDIYKGNVTLTDLPAGEYRVIVRNIGNDNYATCENDAVFNVLKADSGLTSKASENNTVGGNVTITVSANKDATGNVSIMVDGEIAVKDLPLVNGTVQFNVSGLDAGHHSYLVVYEGDNNYLTASDDNSFDVAKNDLVINSTSLNITVPNNTTTAIFTLTLPEDATGYMLVEMDGETYFAPLENGTAILIVPGLNAGNYTANVTYTGDGKYAPISNVTNVTVPSNLPENAISIPSSSSTYNPTYGVNLPNDATGYIEVDVDGNKYYAVVQDGKASVSVPGLSTGAHNVTVTYSGDEKYTKISKSATVILTEPIVILVGADVNLIYSADGEYKVVVTIDGASAVGKTVTINYNGKDYNVVVDSNGYAILKLDTKVKPKKYTITTTFMGAKTTNKVTVKHVVKAKNAKVKQSKKVNKVKVALKKVDGKYLAGKKITIKFKGKKYKVKTNNKGKAKWKVKGSVLAKLKAGKKYKYTATFGKDKVTKKLKVKK